MNGIIFLISSSTCSLSVSGKATHFCVLIFFLPCLFVESVFIGSNSFLAVVGFSYVWTLYEDKVSLTSFFLPPVSFVFLFRYIVLHKTKGKILKKSTNGTSLSHSLLYWKCFPFTPTSIRFVIYGFSYVDKFFFVLFSPEL